MRSIFSNMIQAFDLASRIDQMRQAEQSTRLAANRTRADAVASTIRAVAQPGDGFEATKKALLSLG